MKVFDRFHGEEVDLPDNIEAGRYRLLKDFTLNGNILNKGQTLLEDGALDSTHKKFIVEELNQQFFAKRSLLEPALTSIAQSILDGQELGVSPLIPASVRDIAELAELEKTLLQRIKHLYEINQRPRLSMNYQPEVSSISRARKISPNAISHLAAHSEHWHRRTLSGIQPKRILALFSKDEWTIYENCVYARLLEKLDRYLKERLAEVHELEKQFQNALKLGSAEYLYFRLSKSLYEQWGSAISEKETKRLLDASQNSLQKIADLRKQVSTLRNGTLYIQIPRNLNVAEQLRETNILLHDQHYRHLRTLWLLCQKKPDVTKNIFLRNRNLFENYVLYIGMLIRRVLRSMPLIQHNDVSAETFEFSEMSGNLIREMDEWKLTLNGESLTIIPAFNYIKNVDLKSKSNRSIVYLYSNDDAEESNIPYSGTIISPLEFYGLERIRFLVESFLWSPLFKGYGKPISKVPSKAKEWLSSNGWLNQDGNIVRLNPLTSTEKNQLNEWVESVEINNDTRVLIYKRVTELSSLSSCRQCAKPSEFVVRGNGFWAICKNCNLEWGINHIKDKRVAQLSVSDVTERSFERYGSWCIDMPI